MTANHRDVVNVTLVCPVCAKTFTLRAKESVRRRVKNPALVIHCSRPCSREAQYRRKSA